MKSIDVFLNPQHGWSVSGLMATSRCAGVSEGRIWPQSFRRWVWLSIQSMGWQSIHSQARELGKHKLYAACPVLGFWLRHALGLLQNASPNPDCKGHTEQLRVQTGSLWNLLSQPSRLPLNSPIQLLPTCREALGWGLAAAACRVCAHAGCAATRPCQLAESAVLPTGGGSKGAGRSSSQVCVQANG